jgi:hypothetical protein
MTCSIRYHRPGRPEEAGLILAKKSEFDAYKVRLEASGCVVVDYSLEPKLGTLENENGRLKRPTNP